MSASIDTSIAGTVTFIIGLKSLPGGGTPEVSRYTWSLDVDGGYAELDGKYTNYSRGVCDPTSGKCPPARDPGPQPFFVRGDCVVTGTLTTCQEKGIVQATFDEASATISIPVPLSMLTDNACATIGAGTNLFGGQISATPSAFITNSGMPMDTMETDVLLDSPITAC